MAHLVEFQKQFLNIFLLRIFLSSVVQKYVYMTECIFKASVIVMNRVKYGFHVFKVYKTDVIFASGRSLY